MPPKAKTPAPIDKPLSRAYLREFTGWSTAYPPGISDPTSLRVMENMQINRDGSVRIRPGLRYLSLQDNGFGQLLGLTTPMIGSHEAFFLADGSKAYLFAVKEDDGTVGFRVLASSTDGQTVTTLAACGFTVDPTINFTAATTYVKYLQIDNKIFALSNAGETMRLFNVGTTKSAKRLTKVVRPDWNVADKLTVVQPDAPWITAAAAQNIRTNRLECSGFTNISKWAAGVDTKLSIVSSPTQAGSAAGRVESLPERTNLQPNPLHDVASYGLLSWTKGGYVSDFAISGSSAKATVPAHSSATRAANMYGEIFDGVVPGTSYRAALDLDSASAQCGSLKVYIRWYSTANAQVGVDTITTFDKSLVRKTTTAVAAPAGAVKARVIVQMVMNSTAAGSFSFGDVLFARSAESNAIFTGAQGGYYSWTGTPGHSASVYHPPKDVSIETPVPGLGAGWQIFSAYSRAASTVRNVTVTMTWLKTGNAVIGSSSSTPIANNAGTYIRYSLVGSAPAGSITTRCKVTIAAVPRGEYHYVDSAMLEGSNLLGTYFDGDTPDSGTLLRSWVGAAGASPSTEGDYLVGATIPGAETKTANTLISSTATANIYNFAFFYTFNNEVGESSPSQVTSLRCQRSWAQWRWETANAAGEPSGTSTGDPGLCADQLVASVPKAAWDAAMDQGATGWNLYMITWSDQDPVPVAALQIGKRELKPASTYGATGWLRATPQMADAGQSTMSLPRGDVLINYSDPSRGGQGIVAADRMVLVNDPVAAAVIRWTSNDQGNYTDFSSSKGGGYKTLTSGNLFIPACVKLWQNPQSADTLTILCMGTDGYSAGYYMAPAAITAQTDTTNVMGFEETTATPGTVSPYGVEVMNNALFHPLDEQLMKSTATNYNINHKSMTDQIQNLWRGLQAKRHIVSSQHDVRLYYLVHNPTGKALEPGCWGNEVWVFDTASETGSWSRWLTQGQSLRKIEQGGQIVMSLIHPDGIFYFDEDYALDDVVAPFSKQVTAQAIPWRLETNTQGANRAHDAWAHVQQANIVLGNFQGIMRWGVHGLDIHGKRVDRHKFTVDNNPEPGGAAPAYDLEDFLLVRRDLREWFFYAESVTTDTGDVRVSSGQIDLVQYRYTPSTVNTGYEFGSVETFEYGRAANPVDQRTADNGVPMPYVDTGRP